MGSYISSIKLTYTQFNFIQKSPFFLLILKILDMLQPDGSNKLCINLWQIKKMLIINNNSSFLKTRKHIIINKKGRQEDVLKFMTSRLYVQLWNRTDKSLSLELTFYVHVFTNIFYACMRVCI